MPGLIDAVTLSESEVAPGAAVRVEVQVVAGRDDVVVAVDGVRGARQFVPAPTLPGTHTIEVLAGTPDGEVEHRQVTLTVTDDPPADARPEERWIGQTTFAEGMRLVESADIVVIPSLRTTWSIGQLPAKLVDGMMAGAAVVVSDVEPLDWAVGDGGIRVEPGSVAQLADALTRLTDAEERARLGAAAHRRAIELFTVDANLAPFVDACRAAAARV